MIRPVSNYVLLRPDDPAEMARGLHVPAAYAKASRIATVLRAGPLASLRAGTRVLYRPLVGTTLSQDGVSTLLISEDDILAELG